MLSPALSTCISNTQDAHYGRAPSKLDEAVAYWVWSDGGTGRRVYSLALEKAGGQEWSGQQAPETTVCC